MEEGQRHDVKLNIREQERKKIHTSVKFTAVLSLPECPDFNVH